MTRKIENTIAYPKGFISFIIGAFIFFGGIVFVSIYTGTDSKELVGFVSVLLGIVGVIWMILYYNFRIVLQKDVFTYQNRTHLWGSVKCVYFSNIANDKCILIGLKGDEYQKGVFLEVVKVFSIKEGQKLYEIFRAYAPEDPSLLKLYQKIKNNCYK